jgi:hypothetical protein
MMRSPFLTHPDDPPDDPDVVARLWHDEKNLWITNNSKEFDEETIVNFF